MNLQFAQGHNNAAGLADFAVQPRVTKDIDYGAEYTANGVAKKTGGGAMQVEWDFLTYDELISLMNQFGVTHRAPSTQGTFLLPDWYQIPSVLNGQITLQVPRRTVRGIYENVIADITGLDYP